ncbi:hypothetical protein OPV22_034046 [Ensete ventricosum]|uniref:Uncharacterized protein n=1 Tax=Ensete ventricosum TaxID=4639 RepID=A0AAV8PTI4_ENSVE|nr:hypothetical protein OPV22_034046 [Ensete ventricosum]
MTPLLSVGIGVANFDHVFSNISNGSKFYAMRHGKRVPKLNRPPDQRRALLRGLTTQLLKHGRIKTTRARASAMRKYQTDMEIGMEGIQESSELYQGEEIMHQWLILSLSRALWHTVF